MIQPNYTEKALIPYSELSLRRRLCAYFNRVYYLTQPKLFLFTGLFFAVSVFARCVCVYNPLIVDSVRQGFLPTGDGLTVFSLWKVFAPIAMMQFVSYLSGFTAFDFPVSLLSAIVYFYRFSFLCFAFLHDSDRLSFAVSFTVISACGIIYHTVITCFEEKSPFLRCVLYTFLCFLFFAIAAFWAVCFLVKIV